ALLLAGGVGVALVGLQWPIREVAFAFIDGSDKVGGLARAYFDVRIWSAPASLANYALLRCFIALGRSDIGLVLQLVLNLTNMILDVLFALGFGWGVQGIALGTVMAELVAVAVGLVVALRFVRRLPGRWSLRSLLQRDRLKRTLGVNVDIMIRTLALLAAFVWFTTQGAQQGDLILAANAVLLHFLSLSAFFLDGLAFAAEALVGQAVGAAHRAGLVAAARMTTGWAAGVAVLLSAAAFLLGPRLIELLTVDASIRGAAMTYLPWAALAPLLGV